MKNVYLLFVSLISLIYYFSSGRVDPFRTERNTIIRLKISKNFLGFPLSYSFLVTASRKLHEEKYPLLVCVINLMQQHRQLATLRLF